MNRRMLAAVAAGAIAASSLVFTAPSGQAAPGDAVAWRPCKDKALTGYECAAKKVPLDWAIPSGETITLQMARHRSTGSASARIGSLFFNPGGPGDSGLSVLPILWPEMPESVRERFDIVTWDPRGVGSSTALQGCEPATYPLPPTGPVDWTALGVTVRAEVARVNAACQAANAALVAHVGTNQVVQDLEAMRLAVGGGGINYWGMSYGTRIGYTYALRYPNKIRTMVLDGSVNPNSSIADFVTGFSTAADAGLGFFFELYPSAQRHYRSALATLEKAPTPLPGGTPLTQWDLKSLMVGFAGKEWSPSGTYGLLAQMLEVIDTAVNGSGTAAVKARKQLADLPREALQYALSGTSAAITCTDYADRPTAELQDQISSAARVQAPIAGWNNGFGLTAQCEGLTTTPDPVPVNFGTKWNVPMLIVGATRDANTPFVWTVDMARAFPSSRVLTYVGSKHVAYAAAHSDCVNGHVDAYLVNRRLPRTDVTCPNAYRK